LGAAGLGQGASRSRCSRSSGPIPTAILRTGDGQPEGSKDAAQPVPPPPPLDRNAARTLRTPAIPFGRPQVRPAAKCELVLRSSATQLAMRGP
jgi:hypothetical protein